MALNYIYIYIYISTHIATALSEFEKSLSLLVQARHAVWITNIEIKPQKGKSNVETKETKNNICQIRHTCFLSA